MVSDGVYGDDPTEAVEYLRDKVLGKRLGSAWVEFRPTDLAMGPQFLGLARMKAANRMDLPVIPRVAIGSPHRQTIPVVVIPRRDVSPADVEQALRAAGLDTPGGRVGDASYHVGFPAATSAEQLVAFAQQAILAQGVAPGQGWQWIKRGSDQIPS
jgi:hypothetical protein